VARSKSLQNNQQDFWAFVSGSRKRNAPLEGSTTPKCASSKKVAQGHAETFAIYGIPEKGDAKWLDRQGSFMAPSPPARSSAS
jgi:hypothetical protein